MKFCTNCGKELNDDAVFCTACGTSTGSTPATSTVNPSNSGNTIEQPNTGVTYYQPATSDSQSGDHYQGAAQSAPVAPTGYNQPTVPSAPSGYYQSGGPNISYSNGGPNYPGGGSGKNNKALIIIVSVIIGLCLIGGGIFAYVKLTNNDKDNNTNLSTNSPDKEDEDSDTTTSDAEPSEDSNDASAKPSIDKPEATNSNNSGNDDLSIFDAVTLENFAVACDETGIDINKITALEEYGSWYDGIVYTFTYEDSVLDLLLYDDGTVFSIETGGVQVYIMGYGSYLFDDYSGYTTHFDESYPDNGYVFYQEGQYMDSTVTFESSYDYDYVVELIDQSTGDYAIAFYVQAGSEMSIDVPEGDYYIQYAAGAEWISVDYLFGDDTVFYKSDSIYSFYPENESTITLDINGGSGIASTEITIDDF